MSGHTQTPNNNDWVRLNVGGKVFQTTKDTLSRFPESFLACLVSGILPSDKDETGAFLIDRDPKHFRIILNYLRNGELLMDRKEIATKELLREADFYGLLALVAEINKLVSPNRTEAITICAEFTNSHSATIFFSESRDDYKILQILRDRTQLNFMFASKGQYNIRGLTAEKLMEVKMILLGFGFIKESYGNLPTICWKFVSRTDINRSETIAVCMKDRFLYGDGFRYERAVIFFSETQDDYEVLKALRDRTQLTFVFVNKGQYSFNYVTSQNEQAIRTILRDLKFVEQSCVGKYLKCSSSMEFLEFVRSVSK